MSRPLFPIASTTAQPHGATSYRPDIDGLRALAVLAVVIHHLAPAWLPGGYVGVDVFFVISGYLITKIILAEMTHGAFTFAGFYGRRARRILPALFAVLVATMAVGYAIQLPSDYVFTLKSALAAVLSASNIFFWSANSGYFDATDSKLNPLLHTWSLGVEEQFYLFFPFIVFAWVRLSRRARLGTLVAAALVSLLAAELLVRSHRSEVFYLLPFRAWEFVVGGALACGLVPVLTGPGARRALAVAGLAAIAWSAVSYSDSTAFPGLSATMPVLGAAAVMHAGAAGAAPLRVLTWRPVVFIGLISYSLYLWHWPVLVYGEYVGLFAAGASGAGLALALALLLAVLSYRFIEQPFRRPVPAKRRLHLGWALGIAGAVAIVTVSGLNADGFRARFDQRILALDAARADEGRYAKQCFDQPIERDCVLGSVTATPDTLVWGDSHALSWARGFDEVYSKWERSALLVATSACPPLIDIGNRLSQQCNERNVAVMDRIDADGHLRTVVLVGFWSTYFRVDGPITADAGSGPAGVEGATRALHHTVKALRMRGLRVVVMEPVPVYSRSVPTALAMERITGRQLLNRSLDAQVTAHAPFEGALDQLAGDADVVRLRPFDWLCPDARCKVADAGDSYYRDGNHLRPFAAAALSPQLGEAMAAWGPVTAARVRDLPR